MLSARSALTVCAGWLLFAGVGCATLNLAHMDWRSRKATARNPAIRVVCLWEPAEGRDPKGVPCQGFAGQILFLNSKSLPVTVEGQVRIYLFDNQGSSEDQSKPVHQFDFDSGSWAQHYSYGTLGPAYNVFIPYTRRNISEATCDLRLRLTPDAGPVVFSDMTSIELLGFNKGKPVSKPSINDPRVEETVPEDLTSVNQRRRTTTIALDGSGSTQKPMELPEQATDGIQLAGHQVESEPEPLDPDDVRMAQLEMLVAQLKRDAKRQLPPAVEKPVKPATHVLEQVPASKTRAAAATPPAPLPDEIQDDFRIRLKPRSVRSEAPAPAAAPTKTRSAVASHPLDDDEGVSRPTRRVSRNSAHPLEEALDHPIQEKVRATAGGPRRNPLEDPFDPIEVSPE